MRANLEKLALRLTASLTEAEIFLRRIPNDDPVSFNDFVVSRLRTGEYSFREIVLGDDVIGVTVFFVDHFGEYKELVSVATYANKAMPGFDDFWENEIEKLARSIGCKSVRMSTVRHGLVYKALNRGWNVTEITVRKYFK